MARIIYQDQVHMTRGAKMYGKELAQQLEVPPQHDLVLVRPEGNLVVGGQRELQLKDGDYFLDAPTFEYGASAPD